ncbi:MAG: hypothetical protein A3D96_07480 [Chlamydiae bacterium RIFCSPHIGHO2_12_FULL_44_59]|nr:MAG: hypothetical protein A2796_06790 [Chlamydiae bacterium RIFCSPHIGHO2_01_FULL_44_39]OGN59530.1 MAG: hypothetical protein A3D96_07480 [Chlamydiae bacterium RIFCSPHIGHO2_12_FULL_44_59]OGN67275.1 MAG: hypothetical protein A2978_03310 [Chlamydiae bacterium RIFCSPLOWO2_01_FULL_44_52]OGN68697.1 MAG: hypothetical protein A3I67_03040 [Chlamydiae bacterium RIFCSPLOWO2_02_FULL_45_22]OGN69218.1 MAG: hypothetical protein A3F79_04825 [Chlamydiae bacterium RIFCSPLOWO2_12_FULL_45_20]
MDVQQVAYSTITIAVTTAVGSTIGAIVAASTTATIAYALLAALGSALSIASIQAWNSQGPEGEEDSAKKYLDRVALNLSSSVHTVIQFIFQIATHAIIKGTSKGISSIVERKLTNGKQQNYN